MSICLYLIKSVTEPLTEYELFKRRNYICFRGISRPLKHPNKLTHQTDLHLLHVIIIMMRNHSLIIHFAKADNLFLHVNI